MKIDGGLQHTLGDRESAARNARLGASVGYDRLFAAEAAHDPFLPLALAARAADVDLGTNVAVAFARNPMQRRSLRRTAARPFARTGDTCQSPLSLDPSRRPNSFILS